MAVKSYRDLMVWQRAMDLAVIAYQVTADFPKEEIYGLTSQVRRAAVSVPSNIAEGQGRSTTRDFLAFLATSQGSLQEVETQVLLSVRLGYLSTDAAQSVLDLGGEVSRLLCGLVAALKRPR